MTFPELKALIGNELESRLGALGLSAIGLYYDEVPANFERLYVRFWFPFSGLYQSNYDQQQVIERPLLQVDVRHFPPAGSVATPSPELSERVWEALRFDTLPGLSGCVRQADSRPPLKDMNDQSRWGWHRYTLYTA